MVSVSVRAHVQLFLVSLPNSQFLKICLPKSWRSSSLAMVLSRFANLPMSPWKRHWNAGSKERRKKKLSMKLRWPIWNFLSLHLHRKGLIIGRDYRNTLQFLNPYSGEKGSWRLRRKLRCSRHCTFCTDYY